MSSEISIGKDGLTVSGEMDFGNGFGLGIENGRSGVSSSLTILGSQQGSVDRYGNYTPNENFLGEINGQDIYDLIESQKKRLNSADAENPNDGEEGPSGLVDLLFAGGALLMSGAAAWAAGGGSSAPVGSGSGSSAGNGGNAVVGRRREDGEGSGEGVSGGGKGGLDADGGGGSGSNPIKKDRDSTSQWTTEATPSKAANATGKEIKDGEGSDNKNPKPKKEGDFSIADLWPAALTGGDPIPRKEKVESPLKDRDLRDVPYENPIGKKFVGEYGGWKYYEGADGKLIRGYESAASGGGADIELDDVLLPAKGIGKGILAGGLKLLSTIKSGGLIKGIGGLASTFFLAKSQVGLKTLRTLGGEVGQELATMKVRMKGVAEAIQEQGVNAIEKNSMGKGELKEIFRVKLEGSEDLLLALPQSFHPTDLKSIIKNIEANEAIERKLLELAQNKNLDSMIRIIPVQKVEKASNPNFFGGATMTGYTMPEIPNALPVKGYGPEMLDKLKQIKNNPGAKEQAIKDLQRVRNFLKDNTIGDFQGIMDSKTGKFYVTDSSSFLSYNKNAEDNKFAISSINAWLRTLKE